MEVNLHDTTDASAWAKEFCKRWPSALCQIEGKEGVEDGDSFEGTMIGWFANAIMAGVDSERPRIEALTADTERLQARVAELEKLGPILDILPDAVEAAEKAMRKFPQPNYVISKWAEETGEVTKDLIHVAEGRQSVLNLRGEIVQSLAMLHRLLVEGDEVHGLPPVASAIRAALKETGHG